MTYKLIYNDKQCYSLWGQKYMAEVMLKIGNRDIYLDGKKVGELVFARQH